MTVNIVKYGNQDRARSIRRFTCARCGCVFDATPLEYGTAYGPPWDPPELVCDCPDCGHPVICGRPVEVAEAEDGGRDPG